MEERDLILAEVILQKTSEELCVAEVMFVSLLKSKRLNIQVQLGLQDYKGRSALTVR